MQKIRGKYNAKINSCNKKIIFLQYFKKILFTLFFLPGRPYLKAGIKSFYLLLNLKIKFIIIKSQSHKKSLSSLLQQTNFLSRLSYLQTQ